MKNLKKTLLLMVCVVVLLLSSAFATLAYLTDSEAVTNTFTVGKVNIEMDEGEVDANGKFTDQKNKRVKENTYHLLPGQSYDKDPTIHVDKKSEDCYLFVKVENGIKDIETKVEGDSIAKQMKNLGWKPVNGVENVYVFAKEGNKYVLSKGANVEVFKYFAIDGSVSNETLKDYADESIAVTAYAVQKHGFEDSDPEYIWETALASVANPNP